MKHCRMIGEVIQMKIKKALLAIKGYCEKNLNCDKCQLKDETGYCFFYGNVPYDWDVDKMLKRQRGDSE